MAGNAAELKLNVTLDLAFFRGQLANLAQVTSSYRLPINVSIDRRGLQNELNALGANIRRRNYRLTIETNLSAEIAKAETLARKLGELGGKLKTGSSGFAASPQGAAGLIEYMQSQGLSGAGGFVGVGRSARLKNALEELTVKQLQGLAKSESITGASRLKKSALIDKLMNDLSQQAMENILGNAQLALRRFEAQYKGPIGPLPMGSKEPWARGSRGMYGGAGYEPYMATRQQPLTGFAAMPGIAGVFGAPGFALQPSLPGMAYQMAKPSVGSIGQFPTAGMMGPSTPLTINARTSMFAGGGGGGGRGRGIASGFFDGMGGQIGGGLLGANLPGARSIRELGAEFGNATKQVLLFGTAYKALAFLMDFPSQVGAAVGSLQSFRNTLSAISPTAEEARASNAKILELVDKYNIPLASARDGFTKLYASMQPAGFSGEEIRTLFEGISKGAATFGMSADKVDRVNYAFAQMASKGQVMSEELKGQLGDVLPGAMAIFAEAAGFKGSKAIQDFSAALEEGRYKGDAMRQLLINVGSVMNQEFGPGAEGAARTFQGSINRMQNSLLNLYQAFEPVAVGFLNGVVTPLTGGLKTLTDGFTAFFTGTAAKTSGGFAIAQQLQQLKPSFDGILRNLQQLTPVFKTFLETAGALGRVFVQVAGTPFAGYLLRVYASVLPLTIAIRALNLQALIPLIASLVRSVPAFIAMATAAMQGATTLGTVRAVMAATGVSASVAAGQVRTFSLALRTAFATTVIGAVLVGIGMLIEKFAMMGAKLDEVRAKAQGASQAIRAMTSVEAKTEQSNRERIARDLRSLQGQPSFSLGNKEVVQVSAGMAKRFEEAGIPVRSDLTGRQFLEKSTIPGQILQQTRLAGEARYRQEQLAFEEKQLANLTKLPPIPGGDGDGSGRTKKVRDYYRDMSESLADIGQKEKDNLELRRLNGLMTDRQYTLGVAAVELETSKAIAAERLRVDLARTNDENISANDKLLKQADLRTKYQNSLTLAQNKYNIAVEKALFDIEKPLNDAIRDEGLAIEKSQMQIEAYRQGRTSLTAQEEAELLVRDKIKDYDEEEIALAAEKIQAYREMIAARIENNRLMEQEANLAGLRAQIGVAGAGLGAGFIGEAGGAFEKALLESQGNVDYAMQMARLTEQLSLLKLNADLTRQSIEGIGGAFATTLVDGSMALAEGSKTAQEVFADFLRSIARILADAAKQMIATYIAIGVARMFAGIRGGGGGGGLEAYTPQGNAAFMERTGALGFANGGIVMGGFQAFANGGVVTGPTLGLVGEGRYNEAIIPMPNGRSVPVDLQGATGGNTNVVVNVDAKGSAASGDDTRANALGRVIANAVQEEIIRQKRPGGLLVS